MEINLVINIYSGNTNSITEATRGLPTQATEGGGDPREAVEGGGGNPRRWRRLGETKRHALCEAQTETNGGAALLELVRGQRRLGQALELRRAWSSNGGAQERSAGRGGGRQNGS